MKSLVLGIGVSGQSAKSFLKELNHEVVAVETGPDDESIDLSLFDLIVTSPGIPPTNRLYKQALHLQKPLISEIELGLRHCGEKTLIGITGSNGKTTTTLLLTEMLKNSGFKAAAAGNIGRPFTQELLEGESDLIVVELSSFQLERSFTRKFHSGCILNITPDHLDRYQNFAAYCDAKLRLRELIVEGGLFLFDERGDIEKNAIVAKSLALNAGADIETIEKTLIHFKRPPHRLEEVGRFNDLTFINDSKATNIEATINAVKALKGPIHLICGGTDKGGDYRAWIEPFKEKVEAVYLIGAAAEKIERALSGAVALHRCENMERAVEEAMKNMSYESTLLLSPGCSSYDQYRNYEERGLHFTSLVDLQREKSLQSAAEDTL